MKLEWLVRSILIKIYVFLFCLFFEFYFGRKSRRGKYVKIDLIFIFVFYIVIWVFLVWIYYFNIDFK